MVKKIYANTHGVPRLINVICDRALLGTYSKNRAVVDRQTLDKAIAEVRGEYPGKRQSMLPLVSYLGPTFAAMLTGSVVVEQVFGIPGVGRFLVTAATNRDYTLVLGITIFYSAMIITLNLIVDLLYAFLDPRIRE